MLNKHIRRATMPRRDGFDKGDKVVLATIAVAIVWGFIAIIIGSAAILTGSVEMPWM